MIRKHKTIEFSFAWYDMWRGLYFDREGCVLYWCPWYCCCFRIDIKRLLGIKSPSLVFFGLEE